LTSVGDVFGIADLSGSGLLFLAFSSDTDTTLPFGGAMVGPAGNFYEESQASFDATMYLAQDLQAQGWTAAFRSDNALNNIPEPASLSLLAISAFGLLGIRRRQKEAA
jgi:PEP-CTERM motif